jgi:AcrR family transcriptional regulator
MELFWSRGYEATSLADLTAAMGIAPPSLYAAFGSKEELFREAVARYGAKYSAIDAETFAAAPTARAVVERLLYGAAELFTLPGKPRGCMVITAAMNCSEGSQGVEAAMRAQRVLNEALLRKRVSRAIEEGELPSSADAGAMAKFYAAVLQGMSVQARDGATRAELERVAAMAFGLWPARPKKRGGARRDEGV